MVIFLKYIWQLFLQEDHFCLKCKWVHYEKKVDVPQFHLYQQNVQLQLTSNPCNKTMTYPDRNTDPGLGQAQKLAGLIGLTGPQATSSL